MLVRGVAALLIVTSAAAAPHGPGCQLSTTQCVAVAQEIAVQEELDAEDERTFGLDMPAMPRTEALIRRSIDRALARVPHLPTVVGNEVARIKYCNAMADGLRLGTVDVLPPKCR